MVQGTNDNILVIPNTALIQEFLTNFYTSIHKQYSVLSACFCSIHGLLVLVRSQ